MSVEEVAPAQQTPEHGSARYFALLYTPVELRDAVQALFALETQIRRSATMVNHEVAHTRLRWWREEVDRWIAARPRHPLGETLGRAAVASRLDLGLVHEMLVAADLDLARFTYSTQPELSAYATRSGAALQSMVGAVLAGSRGASDEEEVFSRELGRVLRESEMLCELMHEASRGRWYLPLDAVDAEALAGPGADGAAAVVTGASAPDPVAAWRRRRATELLTQSASLRARLPQRFRASQRPSLVLEALNRDRLERQRRDPHRDQPQPGAGSLRQPVIAWLSAVRSS